MKLNIIAGICIFLIVSLPLSTLNVHAQTTAIGIADDDGDGVCNWARNSPKYAENGLDVNSDLGCVPDVTQDDICPSTRPGSKGVRRGGITNGCAEYQLETFKNYWSVALGDSSPTGVKVNWLLDQSQGVDFYQEVKFTENIGFGGAADEKPEIRNVRFQCDRGKGIVLTGRSTGTGTDVIEGNYLRGVTANFKGGDQATMILKLRQQSEDKVKTKSVTNLDARTIDEIEFNCEAIISQSVSKDLDGDGKLEVIPIYPEEREAFKVRVAINTLVIQPPEQFLERGIDIANSIVDFTDSVIPKLETAYRFAADKCFKSIQIVLAGKILGIFIKGLGNVADFIWYGPEKWKSFSLTSDAFIISGRSMCSYSVCPKNWCRLANAEIGTRTVAFKEEDPATGNIMDVTRSIPVKLGDKALTVQDSLLLSVGCGCISGIVQNLYRLRAIAQNWGSCMEVARAGGTYTGDCERVLQQNICEFVVKEWSGIQGTSLTKKLFGSLWDKIAGGFGISEEDRLNRLKGAGVEAGEAQALASQMQSEYEASKHFGKELAEIGSATGRGFMGYEEQILLKTFCNLAVYGKIPEFIRDSGLDLNKVHMSTTVSGNWRAGIAYQDIDGNPIYGYDLSWMVIAGRENMRYSVYLRDINGGKRPVDRKTGFLRNIGDFDSDYMQITDSVEYVELCIEIPNEPSRSGCYPPGSFATGGIIKDIDILFGDDNFVHTDKDRLPDAWEQKYNCYPGRQVEGPFTVEDQRDCNNLINVRGTSNLLNSNNPDSDGDGIRDDKENPDGDALDNYQEFLQGGNPNHAKKKADGSLVEGACTASFDTFNFTSGFKLNNNQMKFGQNGEVKIKLDNVNVDPSTKKEEVVMKTTVTGRNDAYVSNILLDIADNRNVVVWKIPIDVKTGEYTVQVEFVKLKNAVGSEICTGNDGRIAKRSNKIIVVNTAEGGCWDTDGGNDLGKNGVCVDGSVHAETCSGTNLNEYECKNNKCTLVPIDCATKGVGLTCSPPGFCGSTCFDNDLDNNPYFAGACKDATDVIFDGCTSDGRVVETQCGSNGKCERVEPATSCNVNGVTGKECRTQNLNAIFTQIDQKTSGQIGMCLDKVATTTEESKEEGTIPDSPPELVLTSDEQDVFNLAKERILDERSGEVYKEVEKNANDFFGGEGLLPLFLGMITQESVGKKDVWSKDKKTGKNLAYGLMQLLPSTAADINKRRKLNLNYENWEDNLALGFVYLDELEDEFSDFRLVIAAYNGGPGRARGWRDCLEYKSANWDDISLGVRNRRIIVTSSPVLSNRCHMAQETWNHVAKVMKYRKAWEDELTKPFV